MPDPANSRFDAETVVALKLLNDVQRLEIRLADASGAQHIVSVPAAVAVELANFIADAARFFQQGKRQRSG